VKRHYINNSISFLFPPFPFYLDAMASEKEAFQSPLPLLFFSNLVTVGAWARAQAFFSFFFPLFSPPTCPIPRRPLSVEAGGYPLSFFFFFSKTRRQSELDKEETRVLGLLTFPSSPPFPFPLN